MKKKAIASAFMLILLFLAAVLFQSVGLVKANAVQVQTVQSLEPKPIFGFDLVYAYIQGGLNGLVYSVTYNASNVPSSSEAIIEVYKIEISSDGHLIGSSAIGLLVGSVPGDILMGITVGLPAQSSEVTNDVSPGLRSDSIAFQYDFSPDLDLLGTISVSIKRLGWVTIDGDSVDENLSSGKLIKQVQLEKFGNGFLYNALVPEEQLSHINLFNPTNSSNPNLPSSSPSPPLTPATPSPSVEPTKSAEPQELAPFPITLVIAFVITVAVNCIGLLVYFKKRKAGQNI